MEDKTSVLWKLLGLSVNSDGPFYFIQSESDSNKNIKLKKSKGKIAFTFF